MAVSWCGVEPVPDWPQDYKSDTLPLRLPSHTTPRTRSMN